MLTRSLALVLIAATALACNSRGASSSTNGVAPVYNAETGKLEQLVSDRDGDGKPETRAYMDGAVLKYIEIDRTHDGQPDRWEYYVGGESTANPSKIDHAEEANGADRRITRREFYANGVIRKVIDDTNLDGHADKWESYDAGTLVTVELDLVGKGFPSQRLVYDATGNVTKVETDPEGDGVFVPVAGGKG